MEYTTYLSTSHWKSKRKEKLSEHYYCHVCHTTQKLNIHHEYYEDKKGINILFRERPQDLLTLCVGCHFLVHRYTFGKRKHNKLMCRVRRLLDLGVLKHKAFWIAGTSGMWESLYPQILIKKVR